MCECVSVCVFVCAVRGRDLGVLQQKLQGSATLHQRVQRQRVASHPRTHHLPPSLLAHTTCRHRSLQPSSHTPPVAVAVAIATASATLAARHCHLRHHRYND